MKIWEKNPALYYALAALVGLSLLYGYLPLLLFALLAKEPVKRLGFCLVALAMALYAKQTLPSPPPTHRIEGIGYLSIKKIKQHEQTHSLRYYASLNFFQTKDHLFQDIPCFFSPKTGTPAPRGDTDYWVEGSLVPLGSNAYKLIPSSYQPIPYTFSLAEYRFSLKTQVRQFLKRHVDDELVHALLSSLATGEIDHPLLRHEFLKVGLSHTLAISGFHYTFLILLLGSFLHFFFSKRRATLLLLLLVTLYFLFIGETPSLNRAWLSALIFLTGYLLKRDSSGLNALGLALFISLLLDPASLFNLGFQLSYLATFTLLTLFPFVDKLLYPIMPSRPLSSLMQMSLLSQHAFLLSQFIRKTLALTLSINVATLPLLLYHFSFFPFASFFFNLFFPFALSLTMILLFLSLGFPPFAPFFLKICAAYTSLLLDMIVYAPPCLRGGLSYSGLTLPPLLLFLSLFFLFAIFAVDGNPFLFIQWLQKSPLRGDSSSVG